MTDGTADLPGAHADESAATVRLHLHGALDFGTYESTVARGRDALHATGLSRLVIDMSEVNFIDSMGINALVLIREKAAQAGVALRVEGADVNAKRLFDLGGLTALLDVSA